MTESEMKDSHAYRQLGEAERLVITAKNAHGAGMFQAAHEAAERAIYLLQGASVIDKSLADEKRTEGLRNGSYSSADLRDGPVRHLCDGCIDR